MRSPGVEGVGGAVIQFEVEEEEPSCWNVALALAAEAEERAAAEDEAFMVLAAEELAQGEEAG